MEYNNILLLEFFFELPMPVMSVVTTAPGTRAVSAVDLGPAPVSPTSAPTTALGSVPASPAPAPAPAPAPTTALGSRSVSASTTSAPTSASRARSVPVVVLPCWSWLHCWCRCDHRLHHWYWLFSVPLHAVDREAFPMHRVTKGACCTNTQLTRCPVRAHRSADRRELVPERTLL